MAVVETAGESGRWCCCDFITGVVVLEVLELVVMVVVVVQW